MSIKKIKTEILVINFLCKRMPFELRLIQVPNKNLLC